MAASGFREGVDNGYILSAVWRREVTACCHKNTQISCKILRKVILQPRSKFTPVWKKSSNAHICMGLDRRMYFDNHHLCYYNDGPGGEPCLLYKLDKRVFKTDLQHKILGVLLYHCKSLCSRTSEEKSVCLMVLTADGFLKVLDANTGEILRSVFLSTALNYQYLSWGEYLKTVQVKTVNMSRRRPAMPPAAGGGGGCVVNSRCLNIAIFRIHPLELIACLDIERKIFGEDIQDASVNEDLLVITHRSSTVKMYSLSWIIDNCSTLRASLDKFVELPGEGIWGGYVGNPGFGVPCTVRLTECPPLLFSVKTSNQVGISFGGHPTVYLHGNPNEFSLSCLRKRQLITELKSEVAAFHSDVVAFHFDDHRRVIQISGCMLSCYKLHYDDAQQRHSLHRQYRIDFRDLLTRNQGPLRTSSGRVIKQSFTPDLYTSAVQDVDYENETDLLYAVVTLPDPSSESGMQCSLYFIDEKKGSVLKTVPLPTWEPDGNNSIYYELDCILHLKKTGSKSTCYYYRLCQ